MKKSLSVVLVIVLLLVSILNTYAVEITDTNNVNSIIETHTNEQYGFSYSQTEDCSGRIIRTYKKDTQTNVLLGATRYSLNQNSDDKSYEQTKVLLSELGMNDSSIEELSAESLDKYTNAKSIQSIVTYTKTDIDGNTQIISEDTASKEISLVVTGVPNLPIDFDDGYGDQDSYFSKYSDEYMVITFFISEMGNGLYYYSADAEWLTTPIFRGTDSFGMCVMNNSIVNNTRSGWYRYDHKLVSSSGTTTETITETFTETNFQNCILGNWQGSGALFDLSSDYAVVMDGRDDHYYLNHKVHYEFESYVNTPKEEQYFGATATYEHTTLTINFSPSLEISTGESSASIGLNVEVGVDTRMVELPTPIHHVP